MNEYIVARGDLISTAAGSGQVAYAEIHMRRSYEVIYESVVDVKSFFRQTLTATPERLGYCVARLFAL